jgi:hypothetical protein
MRDGTVRLIVTLLGAAVATALLSSRVLAQNSEEDLAKQLQNPVASLISVPLQSNFDFGLGHHGEGFRYTLNFQPVSLGIGGRYYAEAPDGGPDWGIRLLVTLLFPKK